jgi:ribosomal protein L11 methyltransferase
MTYIEVSIKNLQDLDPEIIVAFLGELGFESFSEADEILLAYCQQALYDEAETRKFLDELVAKNQIAYQVNAIEPENWNARWESEYEPVTISSICQVRAPFHPPLPEIRYDIVIEPKMSFGTAHHETTSLMVEMLLLEELEGKSVLDMGCGTGVLAILAAMKKAARVVAIDTDDWAFENATENTVRNNQGSILVIKGDASAIPEEKFDLIAANINRNVLLEDIQAYSLHMEANGILLMSGFYEEDLPQIHQKAVEHGFELTGYAVKNNWVGVKFTR